MNFPGQYLHRSPVAWILLGLLLTPIARVALLRPLTNLFDLGHRPLLLLPVLGTPINSAATAALVYLLLRCLLLPPVARTIRTSVALPAITILGAAGIGWAYIPVATWLATPLIPTATTVAIDLGTTKAVLTTLTFLLITAGGILLGAGLWLAERLAAALLRLPAPPWLLLAHPVGIAIIAGSGSLFTSLLTQRLGSGITDAPALVGLISLVVGAVAAIPHLALAWFAWRPASPAPPTDPLKRPV